MKEQPKMIYAVPHKVEAAADLENIDKLSLDELKKLVAKLMRHIERLESEGKK